MIVRYNEWITTAWNMFVRQWLNWILLCLLLCVIVMLPVFTGIALAAAVAIAILGGIPADELRNLYSAFEHQNGEAIEQFFMSQPVGNNMFAVVILVMLLLLVVSLAITLIAPPLYAGAFHAAFNQMRTGRLQIGDIFKGFQVFWQSVLGAGVVASLILIGIMFCVIPGIYIAICSVFMLPLIMERRLGFWQAFTESRAMVHRDFLNFFVYFLLTCIISGLAGMLFAPLGFITYPFYFLMISIAARDAFSINGVAAAPGSAFPPPPANQYQPPGQPQQYRPMASTNDKVLCGNCRASIPADSAFCPYCGNPSKR
jgi:hypothetical protein